MDWLTWTLFGGGIAAFLIFKKLAFVSPAKARDLLKGGGIVIDVRSKAEFKGGHLTRAVNIPLDQLSADISRVAPDKTRVLLLHCLSGGRSAIGKATLKKMGYSNTVNLGSYRRAEKILRAQVVP